MLPSQVRGSVYNMWALLVGLMQCTLADSHLGPDLSDRID